MPSIAESIAGNFTVALMEKQGYECIYVPKIAPDSTVSKRDAFEYRRIITRYVVAEK